MLIIMAPAKTLNFENQKFTRRRSKPALIQEAEILIDCLRSQSPRQLTRLMGVSEELAQTTYQQYADWNPASTSANSKQAILAYQGNAYVGLNAGEFSADDFEVAQNSLRILSGLYGVLRPLDLIQPYRLEMATKLKTPRGKHLYDFWGDRINQLLAKEIKQHDSLLINLASNEYFKAIKPRELDAQIITPEFKELRKGVYKSIGTFAKKARGLMASFIIRKRLADIEQIKSFDEEEYCFNEDLSSASDWVFTRESPPA